MDGEELGLIDGSGAEESELDESVVETGEQAEGGQESAEGAEEVEGEQESQREGEEETNRRDAAKELPLQLRKAIKALQSADPEFAKNYPGLAKNLSVALFKVNAINRLGGVQRFQEFSDVLEAHGGPEGIASLAEEVEAGRALEEGFKAGDPAIIDGWAKDYPEGFKALIRPAIDRLEQMDLAAHDQTLAAPMWKTLDRCGVISTFSALETALAGKNIDEALKNFNALKGFFGDLKNLAGKKPAGPTARDQQLDTREQELNQRENQQFYGSVRQDVNGQVMSYINRLIRQELGGAKLRLETANRLRKEINAELARVVNTAKGYSERYKAVMSGGDRERAVRFIVSNAKQQLPAVVKQLIREFNLKPAARAAGNGLRRVAARSNGESRTVAGVPATGDVDFTRTDKARFLVMKQGHGEAYLKNGKLAKW